tara:strand:- start:2301 stop:2792 length:492 start_codon:yes stop_codon:yes gene_type:complete
MNQVSFTRISGVTFITYLITNHPFIGAISFNFAAAVMIGFKSAMFIDLYGYTKCLEHAANHHQVTYNKILIGDFFVHIAPFIYLSYNYTRWFNHQYMSNAFIVSSFIHLIWAYINCNGLNLNQIYLTDCEYQLSDKKWELMWVFTVLGHSLSCIVYILSKEFT